ncbi:methyltransferase domain-containing protein, partial [bacterium]|nr:methyltransferase domain-containing protein [candidate division CSSED10-310 bacterium]
IVRRLFGGWGMGTELSETALIRARELCGVTGAVADAHELPFRDKSFDLTICSEVLEHVTNPGLVVSELERVTRGHVVLTTPAARNVRVRQAHFENLDPGEHHRHLHYFTESELSALFTLPHAMMAARSKFVGRLFDVIAADNEHRPEWREAFLQFVVANSDLTGQSRRALRVALIDRYASPRWFDTWIGPNTVAWCLRLDAALCELAPRLCHDFLVVAGRTGGAAPTLASPKLSRRALLRGLVKEFNAPLLRRNRKT